MSSNTVGRPLEVLLVEDDLEDAGLTFEALKQGEVPCRISLVRDGEEALEFLHKAGKYARAPRPDIVLLDMQLPKLDGRGVLAVIRKEDELANLPVVVMTASATHKEILEKENLRVQDYLTKPFDLQQFLSVVKSLRRFLLDDVILPQ